MTVYIANVVQSTDTFGQWLAKTNLALDVITNRAVTTDSNTAVGNAAISGSLTANAVYASYLFGGNTTIQGDITVGTNTYFNANVAFTGRVVNLGLASNVFISGASSTNRVLYANSATGALVAGKISYTDVADINVSTSTGGDLLIYSTAAGNTIAGTSRINYNSANSTLVVRDKIVANGMQIYANGTYNTVYHTGNFDGSTYLSVTGGTISGNLAIGGSLSVGGTPLSSTSYGGTANNATFLSGQAASYYTDIAGRLGYTPVSKAGDTMSGQLNVPAMRIDSTAPTIHFNDTDAGNRYIHSNGLLIGFLKSDANWACYSDNSGNFVSTGDVTAYSDESLKKNVYTIRNALSKVTKMRGVTYQRKDNDEKGIGVIAQEVQAVIPEAVRSNPDGLLSVSYGNLVGVLIEAIKELKQEIELLKSAK